MLSVCNTFSNYDYNFPSNLEVLALSVRRNLQLPTSFPTTLRTLKLDHNVKLEPHIFAKLMSHLSQANTICKLSFHANRKHFEAITDFPSSLISLHIQKTDLLGNEKSFTGIIGKLLQLQKLTISSSHVDLLSTLKSLLVLCNSLSCIKIDGCKRVHSNMKNYSAHLYSTIRNFCECGVLVKTVGFQLCCPPEIYMDLVEELSELGTNNFVIF